VLGALGCGAFGNPSEEVARTFRKIILGGREEGRRVGAVEGGALEEVVFAIFDEGVNLRVFQEVMKGLDREEEVS